MSQTTKTQSRPNINIMSSKRTRADYDVGQAATPIYNHCSAIAPFVENGIVLATITLGGRLMVNTTLLTEANSAAYKEWQSQAWERIMQYRRDQVKAYCVGHKMGAAVSEVACTLRNMVPYDQVSALAHVGDELAWGMPHHANIAKIETEDAPKIDTEDTQMHN